MRQERKAVANLLRRFADGQVEGWEFDDSLSSASDDPVVEACRLELAKLPSLFPPTVSSHFASQKGVERILEFADDLELKVN
jgi:hypothetical protein